KVRSPAAVIPSLLLERRLVADEYAEATDSRAIHRPGLAHPEAAEPPERPEPARVDERHPLDDRHQIPLVVGGLGLPAVQIEKKGRVVIVKGPVGAKPDVLATDQQGDAIPASEVRDPFLPPRPILEEI